jgi:RNA polymerase sigma-70 factor (ECF subfamily)
LSLNVIRHQKVKHAHSLTQLNTQQRSEDRNTTEEKEIRLRIHAAIEVLPPKCREVFSKSRIEGKKYAEIAEELHISVKTVEVHMGNALRALRTSLAGLFSILTIIASLCFSY